MWALNPTLSISSTGPINETVVTKTGQDVALTGLSKVRPYTVLTTNLTPQAFGHETRLRRREFRVDQQIRSCLTALSREIRLQCIDGCPEHGTSCRGNLWQSFFPTWHRSWPRLLLMIVFYMSLTAISELESNTFSSDFVWFNVLFS